MTDQLISFETAKLAKEKGFNIQTRPFYLEGKIFDFLPAFNDVQLADNAHWCPTQSLLQAYLLEKHGLYATAHPYAHSDGYLRWEPVVQNVRHTINHYFHNLILGTGKCKFQDTQKQAVEISLIEALKLIP